MTPREIIIEIASALQELQIPYMVTGAICGSAYGPSRATKDLDIVIELSPGSLKGLAQRLGPRFQLDTQVHLESITGTTCHRIRVKGSRFYVELFGLTKEPFDQARFDRRIAHIVFGATVFLATAEDALVQKLRWWKLGGRAKDLADAEEIAATVGESLDWDYIVNWSASHGAREAAELLRGRFSR